MQAIVLSIGDELVLGQTIDTNSSYLSDQLARRGIGTLYHEALPDDRKMITEAIVQASLRAELVLISGGLGPTDDDLTRQALADAMQVDLVLHEPTIAALEAYFAQRDRVMPARNRVQALYPRGSQIIRNTCGTAPGIKATLNHATIYVTPGVPREMVVMFEQSIAPDLDHVAPSRGVILSRKINTFGIGESDVADRLGPLMDRARNPKVGTTVAAGMVSIRVRSEFPTQAEAQAQLEATVILIEQAVGSLVFGCEDQLLQHAVVAMLREQNKTVATGESCTGGAVAKMITDIAGSSQVFVGGWVTYSNQLKIRELGVPTDLIARHGAVSEPVARAMALGTLARSGADLALSVTGIAGPEGGTADKPVGTVWVGLADRRGFDQALCFQLGNDREQVRDRAAKAALQMLRLHLLGVPLETIMFGRLRTNQV